MFKGSIVLKQRVTRNDVAKYAGVSTAVVSYVMNNGPQPVSEKTRLRVLTAVNDLGYRTNQIARSLRMQRTRTLGVLISNSINPYFAEIVNAIETYAFNLDYSILVGNTNNNLERQQTYLDSFISRKVDGMIFVSTTLPSEAITLINEFHIPALYIGSEGDIESEVQNLIYSILFKGIEGGYMVGRHLLERGHKRMACIIGARQDYPYVSMRWLRLKGFSRALSEESLSPVVIRQGETFFDGYQAARALLEKDEPPTAIFTGNDLLAIGVLSAAADLKLKVPDQLAVCGFDDIEAASYVNPRLTTIRIPKRELAENAVQTLIDHIGCHPQGGELTALSTKIHYLETQLVVREST
jgi:LacI family transcriptional regulator